MGEARMAQQMGIQGREPARFRHPTVNLIAGTEIVPCASRTETAPVTLAPFPDSGRPAFVASTISSRDVLIHAADGLSEDESQRLNGAFERAMEGLLDEGIVRSDAVLRSDMEGKPDIHVIILGDPYKDNSLRLYCHAGEHEGAKVLFQDARTRKKGADKVEGIFRREGGYQLPKGWDNRKN